MAKTARIFAQIDVNYFEDDRILDAGKAWQLHFASILFCKRTLADGRLSRRQLTRIAPESVGDIGASIATLIRVGLYLEDGDDIIIRSWSDWNESAEDVEAMSEGGKRGNHLRWHVRKGVSDPKCSLCIDRGASRPDIAPESGSESQIRDRSDAYPDADPDHFASARINDQTRAVVGIRR